MRKKMRLACLGLGGRARYLLSLYTQHPDVELIAVCDRFTRNVELTKQYLKSDAFNTYLAYDAMMAGEKPDALFIAIDPDVQVAYACDAMRRGVHVMTEVPAAYSIDQCRQLVDAVEATGRLYQLNEQTRYMYFITKWKEMYEAGDFGHILFMEGEYMHYERWDNYVDLNTGDFWHDRRGTMKPGVNGDVTGAGGASNLAPTWRYNSFKHPIYYLPHELSPLLRITGDRVKRVSCMGTRAGSYHDPSVQSDSRDLEVALMHTDNDTVMRLAAGFTSPHGYRRDAGCHWYHVAGTKADAETARTTEDSTKLWTADGGWRYDAWPFSDPEASEVAKQAGHGGLDWYPIEAFVKAFYDQSNPLMDVYKAVETAAPAIIAARSSELGGVMLEVPDFRAKYGR